MRDGRAAVPHPYPAPADPLPIDPHPRGNHVNHHDHDHHDAEMHGGPEPAAAASDTGAPAGDATASGADSAASEGGAGDDAVAADGPSDDASGSPAQEGQAVDIEALADADPRTRPELLAELLAAEAKRDEYLDDLRRSHADFENYRRRVMRDGALQRSSGKAEVAGALLEVLDDLDRTVAAAEGSSDEDLATGIRLVATKLLDALHQQGLERVDAVEVPFDPNVHEAVQQQPGDGIDGEPKVAMVLRPGYRLDDRVLRAAMVAVEG